MRLRAVLAACALLGLPPGARAAARIFTEAHGRDPSTTVALPALAPVARAVLPAVVGIATRPAAAVATTKPERAEPDPVREIFAPRLRAEPPRSGLATGFVIHEDGWIVTNAHVVEGAGGIEVDLGDEGGKVPAKLAGADGFTDVALLKVEVGHPLPIVRLGDSDQLQIADWLLVVGNPFGLARTVTLGIVSQIGRSDIAPQGKNGYYDFIQTDASINPGSSGGPIVNLRGEVVGIATAINATGQGIAFAIPINMAKQVVTQLRENGRMVRSWMGIAVRELPRERGRGARAAGVMVTGVDRSGPAAAAGLSPGDVILAFDGRAVPSPARLRWFVASAGVGRRVALSVRRGEAERAVQVRLADIPGTEAGVVSEPAALEADPE